MRRITPCLLLACCALLPLPIAAPVHAQAPAATDDEQAVRAVVIRLFDGMRTADTAMVRSVFHPDARLVSTGERDGRPHVAVTAADRFVASIAGAPGRLDEQIYALEIRVDDNLATAWMFYTFHLGDRFSHCGHNAFQLARTTAGWQVTQIADSRRTEPCEPPQRG